MDRCQCGVYEICNTKNGRRYIGSSANMSRRWQHHQSLLRLGKHSNSRLQYAYDRDGKEAFIFSVLAVLDKADQLTTEQRFLDQAAAVGEHLYNFAKFVEAPTLGRKASPETCERMVAAQNRRNKNPEHRQKRSEAMKRLWADPEYKQKRCEAMRRRAAKPAARQKISEAMKRHWEAPTARQKYSDAWTPEQRQTRSDAMRQRWADPEQRRKLLEAKAHTVWRIAAPTVRQR